jgi:hypothetical protein
MLREQLTAPLVAPSGVVDNAVALALFPGCVGSRQYVTGFVADYSAAVAAVKTVTIKKGSGVLLDGPLNAVVLAIGSTDTKVSSTAFQYAIAGTAYAKAAVAAGTTLAAGTIPTNKWGIYLLSINAAGTLAFTAGAANFTTGYATEAAAIAALPATPSGSASVGYVTVLTAVGSPFVGGTDALEGGASGAPSSDTNYVLTAVIAPATTVITLRHDFTLGPAVVTLPGVVRSDQDGSIGVELEASGTGGKTGLVTLFGFSH